jgi:hypothetical protein
MSIEKTQARDAGHAPSAPTIGPLLNVSHIPAIVQPEEGEQLPAPTWGRRRKRFSCPDKKPLPLQRWKTHQFLMRDQPE